MSGGRKPKVSEQRSEKVTDCRDLRYQAAELGLSAAGWSSPQASSMGWGDSHRQVGSHRTRCGGGGVCGQEAGKTQESPPLEFW